MGITGYRRLTICVLLCILVMAAFTAAPHKTWAQGGYAALEAFTAGGHPGILAWPVGEYRNPVDKEVVVTALNEASSVFDRLFEAVDNWRIFVHILPALGSDRFLIARAGRLQDRAFPETADLAAPVSAADLCYVEIFETASLFNVAVIRYTLAHELAHCYQSYNVPAAFPVPDPEPAAIRWWTEGSAEWLATQVYPAPGEGGMNHYRAQFADHRGLSLLDGQYAYDGVFFWGFLAAYRSPQEAIALLREMPRNAGDFPTFFEAKGLDRALFAAWGHHIARNAVPYQPRPEAMYSDQKIDAAAPGDSLISTDRYAFAIVPVVNMSAIPLDQGVKVTLSGIEGHGAFIIPDERTGVGLVLDGNTLNFCDGSHPRYFVVGRAGGGSDEGIRVSVSVGPCDEAAYIPPPELLAAGDTCYAGTWRLISWPGTQPGMPPPDFGSSRLMAEPTSLRLVLENIYQKIPPATIVGFGGIDLLTTITIQREGGATFRVMLVSASQMGTPWATMQTGTGPVQNIVLDRFMRGLEAMSSDGATLHLSCRTAGVLEYRITTAGAIVSYYFAR